MRERESTYIQEKSFNIKAILEIIQKLKSSNQISSKYVLNINNIIREEGRSHLCKKRSTNKMRMKADKNDFTIVSKEIENENNRMKEEIITLQSNSIQFLRIN